MFLLTTIQSSTWGYSIANYTSDITSQSTSSSNVGVFTKPTLAPDGNMYAILTCASVTIGGSPRTNVILKITPGTTNTGSTNWSAATHTYIYPDPAVLPDGDGFAKPNWVQTAQNAGIEFNTGILASNGLIYWPPIAPDSTITATASGKWVVFDYTNDTWKLLTIYPNPLPAGMTRYLATSAVLGTDNKIYVFGGDVGIRYYRITTSPRANSDSSEFGYYTNSAQYSISYSITTVPLKYRGSDGNEYSDPTVALTGIAKGHQQPANPPAAKTGYISDVIVHPNGNIYLLPLNGRGRIFYIQPSQWGTQQELVSDPALITTFSEGVQLGSSFRYAFLEKPRDLTHDINSLKIYLVPSLIPGQTSTTNKKLLYIDPINKTLNKIDMGYASVTSGYILSKRISLANGATQTFNLVGSGSASTSTGGFILTGRDVPETNTTGVIKINRTQKGVFKNQDYGKFTSIDPSQSALGGGLNAIYPDHSKFISLPTALVNNTPFISELVSVKEYGPGITNFNYDFDKDSRMYQIPNDLVDLGPSLFNCMFNKPK